MKLQEKLAADVAKEAEAKATKKALWKQQSEAFQHAMKAGNAVKNGKSTLAMHQLCTHAYIGSGEARPSL